MIELALSLAPGLAICVFVFWKDKFEKEPKKLLVICFFLGVLSALIAGLTSIGLEKFIPKDNDTLYTFLNAFIAVAFIEELSKFIFMYLYAYPKDSFNEPFDGITYSVMVSMGFATIENIMYVVQGGMSVAILRMFTAVPAHAMFAILMGYFTGLAKFDNHKRTTYLLYALLSATALHGLYDFCLFMNKYPILILGALASLIIGYVLSKKAIKLHQAQSPFHPDKNK
ncbi:MAG: PrsW family glutamic-type intramembrane protease [Cytophagaceae bacterium]|nr:PrsW family glutamic-type intramembrane protease [Cytophagaceae bacterium]MDW8455677.1 PrsW family glutamic-type intramembrane protease [Cytophagaceae bacterium]